MIEPSTKLKRQPIQTRDSFTYDDRTKICEKSDFRCCHCGKKVYPDFGATIDHFVPLSEGGTNRDINLIMLCDQCNKEKKSKIYEPTIWIKYLKEEHKKKLEDYFDSYIDSFEFFSRRNVLACDKYMYAFYPEWMRNKNTRKNKKWKDTPIMSVEIDRVDEANLPEALEFYYDYLKRNDAFESKEAADKNMEFWNRFCCVYFVRKNGAISAMFVVSFCRHKGDDFSVDVMVMSKYSNNSSFNIVNLLLDSIPYTITREQHLSAVPVHFSSLKTDTVLFNIARHEGYHCHENGAFYNVYLIVKDKDYNVESSNRLLSQFKQLEDNALKWLSLPENKDDYGWMELFIRDEVAFSNR